MGVCVELYGTGALRLQLQDTPLVAGDVTAVRLVETCGERLRSGTALAAALKLLGVGGDAIEFQWELPALYGKELARCERALRVLWRCARDLRLRTRIVVNDVGVLDLVSRMGLQMVLGRTFNKSFRRLPEEESVPAGRWLTLDAATLFLENGPPAFPWSESHAWSILAERGVTGWDVDGEAWLVAEAVRALPAEVDLFVHVDDVFMASGRFCAYRHLMGRCNPRQCSAAPFRFRYQKDAGDAFTFYAPQFFARGKAVYRSCTSPDPRETGRPRVSTVRVLT